MRWMAAACPGIVLRPMRIGRFLDHNTSARLRITVDMSSDMNEMRPLVSRPEQKAQEAWPAVTAIAMHTVER